MSALNDYKSWHDHYLAMVNGLVVPNQKVYVVDSKQSGSGKIQIVSPSAQKVQRARAAIKGKTIKAKPKRKVTQKTVKRGRVKKRSASKKTKPKRKR